MVDVNELLAIKAQLRQARFPRRVLARLEGEPRLPIVRSDRGTNALHIDRSAGGELLATYSTPSGAYVVATVERVLARRPEYDAGSPGTGLPLRGRHVSVVCTAAEYESWRQAAHDDQRSVSDLVREATTLYVYRRRL